MKRTAAVMFMLLSLLLAAGTIFLCFYGRNVPPQSLISSADADARTEQLMDAISQGDLDRAGAMLSGQPELSQLRDFSNKYSAKLWDAYVNSIRYSFEHPCQISDSGLSRSVTVTALDIPQLTTALEGKYHDLLEERIRTVSGLSFLYDRNDPQREVFLAGLLEDALDELLQEDCATVTQTLTLKLISQDGSWWIVPEPALLQLLCGKSAFQN